MHGTEPETSSPNTEKDLLDGLVPGKDPLDELIEELREQFKRGYLARAAQKEAARRRRIKITLAVLILLAGAIVAAILARVSIHPPHLHSSQPRASSQRDPRVCCEIWDHSQRV